LVHRPGRIAGESAQTEIGQGAVEGSLLVRGLGTEKELILSLEALGELGITADVAERYLALGDFQVPELDADCGLIRSGLGVADCGSSLLLCDGLIVFPACALGGALEAQPASAAAMTARGRKRFLSGDCIGCFLVSRIW
jgi:hypothetical protein